MSKNSNTKNEENKIPIEREENSTPDAGKPAELPEQDSSELKAALGRIEELEKQNAELKDALLRKAAEFENYKRRTENDQLNILKYAAESFIRNILPVYDDLERSLSHIDEATSFDSTKKGLLMVYEKFGKIMDAQGIKKIEAKGKPFDVNLHEALMQQPAQGVPPHTVLEVLETGYMYKDRVIRHSKVIVSQELEISGGTDDPDSDSKENSNENE
ncbi:MAG: nucleotide exchange factor GrpE [Melioribacteraceae bacterium]